MSCCNNDKTLILKQTINNDVTNVDGVWLNGSGAPLDALGIDTNYYIDTDTNDIYYKDAGTWGTAIGNIKGDDGQGIDHVSLTSGTSAPGTTDTYTVWGDVAETINLGTFDVYNGNDFTPTAPLWTSVDTSSFVTVANTGILTDFLSQVITSSVDFIQVGNVFTFRFKIFHSFQVVSGQFTEDSYYSLDLGAIYGTVTGLLTTSYLDLAKAKLSNNTTGDILNIDHGEVSVGTGDKIDISVRDFTGSTVTPGPTYHVNLSGTFILPVTPI